MIHRRATNFFVNLLLNGVLAGTVVAQDADHTVLVPVSVTSEGNMPVTGLKQENFQLLEENKQQKISLFSPDNSPLSVAIILGAGTLVRSDNVSAKILEAVDAFKKTGNPANEYFVDPYGTVGIEEAIGRGLDKLAGAGNRRKILVMFIDDFDTSRDDAGEHSLESAMRQDIPIYFMFIKNQFFRFSGTPTTTTDESLSKSSWPNVFQDVAQDTGGRMIYAEPLGNLQDETVRLAEELKSQYVLGFTPSSDVRNGKWHNLKVAVNGRADQGKLAIRYKRRYFVFK
jgi:Ca-activated chloride channel family protein